MVLVFNARCWYSYEPMQLWLMTVLVHLHYSSINIGYASWCTCALHNNWILSVLLIKRGRFLFSELMHFRVQNFHIFFALALYAAIATLSARKYANSCVSRAFSIEAYNGAMCTSQQYCIQQKSLSATMQSFRVSARGNSGSLSL